MNSKHLRAKGWSEGEIEHAKRVFAHAEAHRHQHYALLEEASFWLLILLVFLMTLGVSLFLLPVLLFMHPVVIIVLSLVVGACVGFLVVAAMASLGVERRRHQLGMSVLVISALALMTILVSVLLPRFRLIAQPGNALLLSVPFLVGLVLPYVLDRRLHGSV